MGEPRYPAIPSRSFTDPQRGGLHAQRPWPNLWPLRNVDRATMAQRSVEALAALDERARRVTLPMMEAEPQPEHEAEDAPDEESPPTTPARSLGGRFMAHPPRDASRATLAAMIAQHAEARERLERTQAALSRASDMGFEASRRAREIETAIEAAKESAGRRLVDSLLTNEPPAPDPVATLEAELGGLVQRRQTARQAEAALQQQLAEEERAADRTRGQIHDAAAAVLGSSPTVLEMVERTERSLRELVDGWDHLLFLLRHLPYTPPGSGGEITERARAATAYFEMLPRNWTTLIREKPGPGSWEDALQRLESDPDAIISKE